MDWKQDLVMMKGGHMIMMINGETLLMENDVFTADGALVKTDGTLILPDGQISTLREDEAIPIDIITTRIAES